MTFVKAWQPCGEQGKSQTTANTLLQKVCWQQRFPTEAVYNPNLTNGNSHKTDR